ncbi:MAG: hypothetical protein JWQ78_900 [Sediminibacterium sp.]|nr:hypothetical protein [Sediminibacterium sp.]
MGELSLDYPKIWILWIFSFFFTIAKQRRDRGFTPIFTELSV